MKGKIISTKTFRYTYQGDIENAEILLFVLHGYGQLSEFFIRKFKNLPDKYLVVAPEGMHRFYLQGNSGRVGASWMTKEEREDDISDNILWLDKLMNEFESQKTFRKKIILGFSQGGATAARWYYHSPAKADQLILWASVFPPDLNFQSKLQEKLKPAEKNIFLVGKEDEFYNSQEQLALIKTYQEKGFITLHFEGKHDIQESELSSIFR